MSNLTVSGHAVAGPIHRSMAKHYPTWTAEVIGREDSQLVTTDTSHTEYTEFILSSNWILRPEGLRDFYDKVRVELPSPEITFDVHDGCFRIRCQSGEEEHVVKLTNQFMNEIVQAELNKLPQQNRMGLFDVGDSRKVRHINEWRVKSPDAAEIEAYEIFSYPRKIMEMSSRTTWRVPREEVGNGITIQKLFVRLDPVETMQSSTGCVVVEGTEGLSMHFGADSKDSLQLATKKMDTILRFYNLPSQVGETQRNILYAEDETRGVAELRYMAQVNRRFLTTVFLDPRVFGQLEKSYGKVFEKGCFVRMMPYSISEKAYRPMKPVVFSPATSQDRVSQAYNAFVNYRFCPKERAWSSESQAMSIPRELVSLAETSLENVNPQAAPRVWEWTQRLPAHTTEFIDNSTPREPSVGEEYVPQLLDLQEPHILKSDKQVSHGDLAPVYQSRSSMASSPQTTNASSLAVRPSGFLPPHMRNRYSPSPIKTASSRPVAQISETCETTTTDSSSRANYIEDLNMALKGLRFDNLQSTRAEKPKLSQVIAPSPSVGNSTIEDPFIAGNDSKDVFDYELFGRDFAPESTQASTDEQPRDLLSLSPEKVSISMPPLVPTPRVAGTEQRPPQFFSTMNQQARSRASKSKNSSQLASTSKSIPSPKRIDPDPLTMGTIYTVLSEMLEPLRIFRGSITLKADIGRFVFTKINWQHISIPGTDCGYKGKSVEDMEEMLKSHTHPGDLFFTKIFSVSGADANYLGSLKEVSNPSTNLWKNLKRRVVYEFSCMTKDKSGGKHYFFLDVDADNLSYSLRSGTTKPSNIFVHCMKRTFDFRLTVGAAQNIEGNYGSFAREVVESLRVIPQSEGPPVIEFANFRAWEVQTKSVRICHVATYANPANTCQLDITQVQMMKRRVTSENKDTWFLTASPGAGSPRDGLFPVWYEASVRSTMVDAAFVENEDLGFADEAQWTPKALQQAGAFAELMKSTADTVKQMDGVAYWCNNQQDDMRYGKPPFSQADVRHQNQATAAPVQYW
ncbi:hypothetical protein BJ170DRAFT_7720 [Xylariales sp. AK1849]|nr:hypothetical protein BJ170DRAFT_7720 [Xylariales sp. AK1849]